MTSVSLAHPVWRPRCQVQVAASIIEDSFRRSFTSAAASKGSFAATGDRSWKSGTATQSSRGNCCLATTKTSSQGNWCHATTETSSRGNWCYADVHNSLTIAITEASLQGNWHSVFHDSCISAEASLRGSWCSVLHVNLFIAEASSRGSWLAVDWR